MNKHDGARELIYVHMNHPEKYVLTYGIEFPEFLKGLPIKLSNLLLLRHNFDDGHFNMHTMLDYVDYEMTPKLAAEDVYGYGDFCWIDFEEEENLNQLNGQEMAELLYLGHYKDHLRSPFSGKISNQVVYLAHDDGWYNKTYYRSWNYFYSMLGNVISEKINNKKEKLVFTLRKKKEIPAVPAEIVQSFISHMKEGIAFSIEHAVKNRQQIEIPVWVMGDYYDMDAMYEEYEMLNDRTPDGKLVYDRKSGEWQAFAKYTSS
ncbi:hypothetical protein [Bacillus sp. FSL K6-3431]|uniref:hypothetical protein n=1 Tax=Bacillus sp. FSL K6-3431 TaxID=2921500 RepID=UPI0030F55C81